MMAAPIAVTGSTFEPGPPILLFPTRIDGEGADIVEAPQYDVAADGRFLINTVLDSAAASMCSWLTATVTGPTERWP